MVGAIALSLSSCGSGTSESDREYLKRVNEENIFNQTEGKVSELRDPMLNGTCNKLSSWHSGVFPIFSSNTVITGKIFVKEPDGFIIKNETVSGYDANEYISLPDKTAQKIKSYTKEAGYELENGVKLCLLDAIDVSNNKLSTIKNKYHTYCNIYELFSGVNFDLIFGHRDDDKISIPHLLFFKKDNGSIMCGVNQAMATKIEIKKDHIDDWE